LKNQEKQRLINYRLERADESIQAAHLLFKQHLFIPAMNRIYYGMFYAVQALLALDNISFSKHIHVRGHFNLHYIKTSIFPVSFGKLYNTVFEYRQKFDYVDFIKPDETTVKDQLQAVEQFIPAIRNHIQKKSMKSQLHHKGNVYQALYCYIIMSYKNCQCL